MVIRAAKINNKDENYFLDLELSDKVASIPLTIDDQNSIKNVFNELIAELKSGKFKFELEEGKTDLYWQISNEYIKQLNNEISSIFDEMTALNLTNE